MESESQENNNEQPVTTQTKSQDSKKPIFSMSVITYDYTMVWSPGNKAADPIIRVFGTDQKGQRALCHIRGIYPTIYTRPSDMCMPGWRRVDGK